MLPLATLQRYCEIIAALKLRTTNGKGRHLSTRHAIALLEEHGVETPDGHVRAPAGLLRRATVDRHLLRWFCQVSRHQPWLTRIGLGIWPALTAGWMGCGA